MSQTAASPETRLWTPAGFTQDDWSRGEEFAAAGTNGRVILPLKAFLDMTAEDRLVLVERCRAAASDQIVMTHGTDTMTVTAAVLAGENLPKTIILTGAMIPYAFGMSSDGFFNLGSALAFVQSMPHGVYVVMNGRCFPWNGVRKNLATGTFEAI